MHTIGFLGFGNMAAAIAKGIIESGFVDESDIVAYDPAEETIDRLEKNIVKSKTALQMAECSKYIFLCVKPQMLDEAVAAIAKAIDMSKVIISIAAGVTVDHIKALTGATCPVVRVMPNTPLLLGNGATAIAKPEDIKLEDYEFICDIFRCVGSLYEIPHDKFNEVTPVNGSSPAFIYLFSEVIAACASECGLDYKTSLNMFADTLIGSAKMIKESGYDVDELISMVSSKGGTTIAALDAMRESGFVESLKKGFAACVERAYQLGKSK